MVEGSQSHQGMLQCYRECYNVTIHQKVTRFADFVECDGNHSKYNEAVKHSESFIFLSYFSLLHKGKTWCDVTQHACVINV